MMMEFDVKKDERGDVVVRVRNDRYCEVCPFVNIMGYCSIDDFNQCMKKRMENEES